MSCHLLVLQGRAVPFTSKFGRGPQVFNVPSQELLYALGVVCMGYGAPCV